jgi:prolyl 4-hydroxylase
MATKELIPDRDALRRVGDTVRKRLAANPRMYKFPTDKAEIFAIGDFLTRDECRRLMLMIDTVARPSDLYDQDYSTGYRTSYSGDFDAYDPLVRAVSRRIDDLLGINPAYGESIQGQRYFPGQEFKPHNDWFPTDQPYWKAERKRGGQRSWTAMAFLNTVDKGGETHFVDVGVRVTPKPGVLMVWNNALPDGSPNEHTLHAGTPVEEGIKYVLTRWYRTRKWT